MLVSHVLGWGACRHTWSHREAIGCVCQHTCNVITKLRSCRYLPLWRYGNMACSTTWTCTGSSSCALARLWWAWTNAPNVPSLQLLQHFCTNATAWQKFWSGCWSGKHAILPILQGDRVRDIRCIATNTSHISVPPFVAICSKTWQELVLLPCKQPSSFFLQHFSSSARLSWEVGCMLHNPPLKGSLKPIATVMLLFGTFVWETAQTRWETGICWQDKLSGHLCWRECDKNKTTIVWWAVSEQVSRPITRRTKQPFVAMDCDKNKTLIVCYGQQVFLNKTRAVSLYQSTDWWGQDSQKCQVLTHLGCLWQDNQRSHLFQWCVIPTRRQM